MVGEGRKDVSFSFCSATPKREGTEKLKAVLSRSLPFLLLICIPWFLFEETVLNVRHRRQYKEVFHLYQRYLCSINKISLKLPKDPQYFSLLPPPFVISQGEAMVSLFAFQDNISRADIRRTFWFQSHCCCAFLDIYFFRKQLCALYRCGGGSDWCFERPP